MQDRVPGAPGQYKAVITETELQKMQAGEQFTITMVRDDQPTVEGTPYSKAAVLPDALAEGLCPNIDDPTPADAFEALHVKAIEDTNYPSCYYRMVDGEKEWINPPMEDGVEYRTAERNGNKPVYTKRIVFTEMPASGETVSADVFPAECKLVAIKGLLRRSVYSQELPYVESGNVSVWLNVDSVWHSSFPEDYPNAHVSLCCSSIDLSGSTAECIVRYVKE